MDAIITYNEKEFYPLKGYEGIYSINTRGTVLNNDLLKLGSLQKTGYITACLSKDKKYITTGIHRLVAITFIPNPENKPQVNHINGIKSDNRLENLEWVTKAENQQHALKTGLRKVGVKYNVEWRKQIKNMKTNNYSFKKGFNQVQLGKATEVKEKLMSVLSITTRASWGFRLNGKIIPKVSEAEAIEAVFKSYGIKEIWGE